MKASAINRISPFDISKLGDKNKSLESSDESFDSIFKSAYDLLNNTSKLTNEAEKEEIKYAAGEDNTLQLMMAQNKANLSLSYTVAIRDRVIDAYKEIMNMQF